MMRVLHIHGEFQPQSSGVARHIAGLCTALHHHWQVHPVVMAPRIGAHRLAGPDVVQGGWAALSDQIRAADIVHVHGSRTGISAVALRLARRRGKPTVFTPHCYYQGGGPVLRLGKRLWDRTVESGTVRMADAVVLLHESWPAIMAELGLHPRRIAIIPNCIDADHLTARLEAAPAHALPGTPALLSIGRLDPVKRLDDAIGALTRPGLETAHLHIVGEGGDRQRLTELAQSLTLTDRVHFHGWLDDDAAAARMKGADAMLLASEREGLPTVMLEALAARIPIIASDIEGNRAVADAAGWPHLFPLGDQAALAACVRTCLQTPFPQDVSLAVLERFSWQSQAGRMASLYQDLLGA